MDAVITYVNGLDPVWQASYREAIGREILAKRFRDWGTLKYLLRGIRAFMPYIENVYLVVSGQSQVPGWIDRSSVRVVSHREFVPGKFLPTFNCNPLEMYLHRIPDLSEEFIYFNDDFFPVAPSAPEDFFRDGKAVLKPSKELFSFNMYKKICRTSDRLARSAAGKNERSLRFLRPQHICAPMLKSVCEELSGTVSAELEETASHRIRTSRDLNQYLYTDYMFLTGHTVPGRLSNRHISLASTSVGAIGRFLEHPTCKFVCINDVKLSESRVQSYREVMLSSFGKLLPEPSVYELK